MTEEMLYSLFYLVLFTLPVLSVYRAYIRKAPINEPESLYEAWFTLESRRVGKYVKH